MSTEQKRRLIDIDHPAVPITRQCELLGLARSSCEVSDCGRRKVGESVELGLYGCGEKTAVMWSKCVVSTVCVLTLLVDICIWHCHIRCIFMGVREDVSCFACLPGHRQVCEL